VNRLPAFRAEWIGQIYGGKKNEAMKKGQSENSPQAACYPPSPDTDLAGPGWFRDCNLVQQGIGCRY
jgi:hypothetical protein